MRVDGTGSGNVIQGMQLGMGQQTDAVSRDLQRQIEDAQKKLQEISSSKELSEEEKMKKRQEIQKQISELQNQLRQHQVQQRQEAAKTAKKEKKNADGNSTKKTGDKNDAGKNGQQNVGFSQAGMKALLSADAALDQAQIQGNVASGMNGKANVLEAEIKQDEAMGGDTTRKQEELAVIEQKAANAASGQMESLRDANATLQEAAGETEEKKANAVSRAETEEEKDEKKDGSDAKEEGESSGSKDEKKGLPSIDIRL